MNLDGRSFSVLWNNPKKELFFPSVKTERKSKYEILSQCNK